MSSFRIDHDFHIHSKLSLCSNDELQTKEDIFAYAKKYNLEEICVTDHFWDENIPVLCAWYEQQKFSHIKSILPLPQDQNVKFYFGCEADMDKNMQLGLSRKMIDKFDFIVISTTHMHFTDGLMMRQMML